MSQYKVGQTVETSANQQGLVKYIGKINVADGTWLGIELPTPNGKNDGSVRGERYFTCPVMHGLFVKDTSIVRIIAQPAPKTAAPAPKTSTLVSKTSASAPKTQKPRPSSVVAPKPAPRESTFTKRQSVAPSTSAYTSLRARKPSTTGAPTTASASSSSAPSASRDHNLDILQTKIRHLEKQHTEDQERLKELGQARDERDRFHGIIQKLQAKCQALHQDLADQKFWLKESEDRREELLLKQQRHDIDEEEVLIEREMALERAEQAEDDLAIVRSKLEERDLELEILREEAELFNADMSAEDKEEAGYYRLQHENDRLRQALIALKEMTGEQEHELRTQIKELEGDIGQIESLRKENTVLKEQVTADAAIIEHLRAQVDAAAEWEAMSNELTTRNHELEDRLSSIELIVQDLESLRELNEELELQHAEQEEEMRADIEAKDLELAEQQIRIESQEHTIADSEDLIGKFRELVLDLQSKMQDADSSRSMTDDQVKTTTNRFNEVMELNRRLRASDVQATAKLVRSELHKIEGDEAKEKLAIYTQTASTDFSSSEPLRAYFSSKSIAAKASLVSSLLAIFEKHTSYSSAVDDEALTQLSCDEAISHLKVIQSGSDRLWSVIAASPLSQFADFGPAHAELISVEKSLDHGLAALSTDSVNLSELVNALGRSCKTLEALLDQHRDALNVLEIERGPTPWSQKAKEMEAARRQSAEASILLDNLRAEQKATLLSLRERERDLETKDLEIEHLEAKFRDATTKVGEIEQLRGQMRDGAHEIAKLRQQVQAQQTEMAALETRGNKFDATQHARQAEDDARPTIEQPVSTSPSYPGEKFLSDALRDENHWLRLREHSDLYQRSLEHCGNVSREHARVKVSLEGRFSVKQDYESVSTLVDDEERENHFPARNPEDMSMKSPVGGEGHAMTATAARLKMPPLVLDNIHTSWQLLADSVSGAMVAREDHLESLLSTISEEDDDVSVFEGFSDIVLDDTMELEGFSEISM